MFHQHGKVVFPLPQWRQKDRDHVEAVEEVLAKIAVFGCDLKVFIRSGQYPDVNLEGLCTANPLKLALLDNPQQFDLEGWVQFPDLIQQDGPAVGQFKAALARIDCTGKGASFVPKQLRFQQFAGYCTAVYGDKRFVQSVAAVVDCLCHKFLTCTAFAIDKYRRVRVSHLIYCGMQLLHL
ncbi:hypothetical protein MBAV_003878 [Candidatus Magnetobacterium bavaricum]|uniref:Uncharacterized protein n=1 Tax=Candidatus Magnetobacterium bavaricum TaxID=29290 RepID=A0A0F3GPM8_9BACT|nr:hypothetical protein MBAV_003878 [Candidatus Magnetobacterium bavaricum]